MNTARDIFGTAAISLFGKRDSRAAFRRGSSAHSGSHLRLVVDNTSPGREQQHAPAPVFRLPAWFDRAGRVIWYSVIGLGIINVMNQIMLW